MLDKTQSFQWNMKMYKGFSWSKRFFVVRPTLTIVGFYIRVTCSSRQYALDCQILEAYILYYFKDICRAMKKTFNKRKSTFKQMLYIGNFRRLNV